ncbi:hypothetical protein V8C35DRAFT_317299 [Trichoderma chlorosporum]
MSFNISELSNHCSPGNPRMYSKHPHRHNRGLDSLRGPLLPPAYAEKDELVSNTSLSLVLSYRRMKLLICRALGFSRGSCWKICDEETVEWC